MLYIDAPFEFNLSYNKTKMRIREQAWDSNIKISKFKFNCDECDKSIPNPLPQNLNHFLMIVGKPGSSKTTLLLN